MHKPESIPADDIVEAAKRMGVYRGSLHAQISLAEGGEPLDPEKALAAMPALNNILAMADGAP